MFKPLCQLLSIVLGMVVWVNSALAQDATGATKKEVAERLQRGVDNPEQENNIYRGGEAVTSVDKVKENMRKLFKKLLVSESGGEVDKAYNPHLRDAMFDQGNRTKMATIRKQSGAIVTVQLWLPFWGMCWACSNKYGVQTACDLCNRHPCPWHVPWYDKEHLHNECCARPFPIDTSVYEKFTEDTNFKACCVRKDMEHDSEELIACKSKHPVFNPMHSSMLNRGDGWAGLTEVDFWMTALGLENDRGTSMIATRDEVRQCVEKTDQMMENPAAVDWVAKAIDRNKDWAGKAGGSGDGSAGDSAGGSDVNSKVQEDISQVRPSGENKKLRFSDSVGSEGMTIRPNLAVMERSERQQLARRFCFRPEQFFKLMNPVYDPLQIAGGPDWRDLTKREMLWASYCPNGAALMTNPALSEIKNLHRTSTDFIKGMQAWQNDPMYCQRIHATQNANFRNFGLEEVLDASAGAAGASGGVKDAQSVGYTCMEGGKLNVGMVPVTYLRNRVVERRTAIADKLFGFFIAGTLATELAMAKKTGGAPESYLKGFEPRPYSFVGPQPPAYEQQTFIGKQFTGVGTNELGDVCVQIGGNDYQFQNRSDQLYLSDYTHKSFTQDILVNTQSAGQGTTGDNTAFNKYVQEWAKQDLESQKMIAKRGVEKDGTNMSDQSRDKNVLNYASASRIVAVCPENYTRWRPPPDKDNAALNANLGLLCREENFGSPVAPRGR